jgi:hypothetical protein
VVVIPATNSGTMALHVHLQCPTVGSPSDSLGQEVLSQAGDLKF